MNALRISAKQDGFRRCGIAHPAEAVDHPAGTFTEKEIRVLKADPMLVVQDAPGKPAEPKKPAAKKPAAKKDPPKADPPKKDPPADPPGDDNQDANT